MSYEAFRQSMWKGCSTLKEVVTKGLRTTASGAYRDCLNMHSLGSEINSFPLLTWWRYCKCNYYFSSWQTFTFMPGLKPNWLFLSCTTAVRAVIFNKNILWSHAHKLILTICAILHVQLCAITIIHHCSAITIIHQHKDVIIPNWNLYPLTNASHSVFSRPW